MQKLNALHEAYGAPPIQKPNDSKKLCGDYQCPYWPDENSQSQLDQVYKGLGLIGYGGITYRQLHPDWRLFLKEALRLLADYQKSLKKTSIHPILKN